MLCREASAMKALLASSLLILTGCAHPTEPPCQHCSWSNAHDLTDVGAHRVEVQVTGQDQRVAKAKALDGADGEGWVFDPLFATARNDRGDDTAVCGHAHQTKGGSSLFFAYYQGELLLWDERAPTGISVENEVITLICSVGPA
jgi:hypothetical protein